VRYTCFTLKPFLPLLLSFSLYTSFTMGLFPHYSRSPSSYNAAFSPPSDITHVPYQLRILTRTHNFSGSHYLLLSLATTLLFLVFICSLVIVIRSSHYSHTLGCEPPYKLPPLKCSASPNRTIGLKRFDSSNWLIIDDAYTKEYMMRSSLLTDHKDLVLQCLPGSEGYYQEVLTLVANFLATCFPKYFALSGQGPN
jgi:hypothetical protein